MSFPRYEKYKNSGVEWLGEVPEHWNVMRLSHLTSMNDEVLSEDTEPEFTLLYVDISSLDSGTGTLNTEEMRFKDAPSRARRKVRHGDVLVSTVRTYLRAVAPVVNPPANMIASTGFAVIRANAGSSSSFLRFALLASSFIEEVIARSTGVSYPAINAHDLGIIHVPTPPGKTEQLAVASFLDQETAKIDALIEEQRRLIALLKEKRQAVISTAVTKGINPAAVVKASGVDWIGDTPAHWSVKRLNQVANIVRGGSPRPAGDPRFFDGEHIPWITVGEITKDNCMFLSKTTASLTEKGAALSRQIPEGTLVLTNSGATLGVPKILKITGCANDGVLAFLDLQETADKQFLYYALASLTEELRERVKQGSGQPNLNTSIVGSLELMFPHATEQRAIVSQLEAILKAMGALTAEAGAGIKLLRERRSALISAAVTGKIDVRNYTPRITLSAQEAHGPA